MGGTRERRRRRQDGRGEQPRRGKAAWRETFDSFGGFLTLGLAVGVLAIVALLIIRNPIGLSVSDSELLGDEVTFASAGHLPGDQPMVVPVGDPPAGGPHFGAERGGPLDTGFYEQEVPDGNAVHSLEHGIVWISYNPELVDAGGVELLRDVYDSDRRDVIVSPRAENSSAVTIVSWGRILRFESVDVDGLREFIRTNRNRSPEPGIR